jgi:SAM-dependent MidA family methyltransferase
VAVEVSQQQRQQHPSGVLSLPELPAVEAMTGVVIANELLDNLPFRLAVFDGGWREVMVSLGRGSEFEEHAVTADPAWDWLPPRATHGARLPIQDDAAAWVAAARFSLHQGTVIVFDYCSPSTASLAAQPWREWLRTYRAHGRGQHYLREPGTQDITAQVCLDQLPQPVVVESQADFLRRWGIDELVGIGQRAWAAAAAQPDVAAMTMRSRTREAEALLDPLGLGAFGVASWPAASRRPNSVKA